MCSTYGSFTFKVEYGFIFGLISQIRQRFPNLCKHSEMHPLRDFKTLEFAVRTTKSGWDFVNVFLIHKYIT